MGDSKAIGPGRPIAASLSPASGGGPPACPDELSGPGPGASAARVAGEHRVSTARYGVARPVRPAHGIREGDGGRAKDAERAMRPRRPRRPRGPRVQEARGQEGQGPRGPRVRSGLTRADGAGTGSRARPESECDLPPCLKTALGLYPALISRNTRHRKRSSLGNHKKTGQWCEPPDGPGGRQTARATRDALGENA
jgi:hypothetical protein